MVAERNFQPQARGQAEAGQLGSAGPRRACKYTVTVSCCTLNREGSILPATISLIAGFIFTAGLSAICARGLYCISEELERHYLKTWLNSQEKVIHHDKEGTVRQSQRCSATLSDFCLHFLLLSFWSNARYNKHWPRGYNLMTTSYQSWWEKNDQTSPRLAPARR